MSDTVEDIDRQIQELIQQKKFVSNQNLNGISPSHSPVVKASSQDTTSKGRFAMATASGKKVKNRATRDHTGYQEIKGTNTTKLASQDSEVCTLRSLNSKNWGISGVNLQ